MGNRRWKSAASLILAAVLTAGSVNVAFPAGVQAAAVGEARDAATV